MSLVREDPLVSFLERCVENRDRAVLASLRSALRPGREFDGLRHVLPFVGAEAGRRAEDDALLLACLFALHPESGELSLAQGLARIYAESESESTEGRFRALLTSDREDLPIHLRHAVSLLASKKIPIDWRDLHRTIRSWGSSQSNARRQWARDFWAREPDRETSPADEKQAQSERTP